MLFGISKKRLARLLHDLGTMLEAGLTIRRALTVLAKNPRDLRLGRVLRTIGADIEQGFSLTEAVEHQGPYFPPLMKQLLQVAEASGSLGPVCLRLAAYYEMQVQIRRKMLGKLAYPTVQILAAIFIIYMLNFIFGSLAQGPLAGAAPIANGVLVALQLVVGLIVAYFLLKPFLSQMRIVDDLLLHVPLLGKVMRTLAMARFSWALHLMLEAGAGTMEALTRSMRATNNGAFTGRAPRLLRAIADGAGLRDGLEETGLFPLDYLEIISVAEESGMLSESLDRQATARFEDAERAITALTTAIAYTVRVAVMIVIVAMIFALARAYFGQIGKLTSI